MERRFAVHAGPYRQALIAALAIGLAPAPAVATPASKPAKLAFDRAVAAYTKGNFTLAAELFAKSYSSESDPDALFGWAQAERKLDHCDKAVELYERLLALDIPQENKDAVKAPLAECKATVDAAKPKPAPKVETVPAPEVVTRPERVGQPPDSTPPPPPPPAPAEGHAWWRDPVGDALVGVGVVGLGVGTALIISGHGADQDAKHTQNYFDFQALEQKAHDRGEEGVIGMVAGGLLVAGGIYWYASHRDHGPIITGWLTPAGGVLAVGGGF